MKHEAMLKNELKELKSEYDNKGHQFNSQLKLDKDNYKHRINEAEKKNKEADVKRS